PAPPVEQPVDLVHQLAQPAELRPAAGDPPQRRPLGGAQMPPDEQVAVVEQLADLPLDRLVAAGGGGGAPRAARRAPPARAGAVAASRLRSCATAERTALVTSRRTWKVQT